LREAVISPRPDWGPALSKYREGRYAPERAEKDDVWNSWVAQRGFNDLGGVDAAASTVTLQSYISTPL